MRVLLSFLLYTTICWAIEPSIVSRFESNELFPENNIQTLDGEIEPTIDPNIAEDANLTTPQLITKYGYNVEVYYITTQDGYILQMHRISGGKKYPPKKGKRVCFLQHGLFDSSATWVLAGPGHGLGYLLADDGYDVWLGNTRGNRYSCNHTSLNPYGTASDRKKFWSFSWHEMGVHDLPTMIDFVLDKTEQSKLQYIAHSQGATAFLVMTSQRPEYNDKIEMMHGLAPVAYMSHVASPPIRVLAPFVTIIEKIIGLIGVNDFKPSTEFFKLAGSLMCRDQAPTQLICSNILFLLTGYNSDQLNKTLLPVILAHTPAGAATDQLVHYGQLVNSGRFRQFDHGRVGNLIRYKRTSPPDYNLNNVKARVAIYHSQNDWLAVVKDAQRLANSLPNVVIKYLVPHKKFNHIDFIWGIDAPFLLYDEIIRTMREGNNKTIAEPNMNIDIRDSFE